MLNRFLLFLHSIPYLGEKTLTRILHHNATRHISPDACLALPPETWQTEYELDPRAVAYLAEHRTQLLAQSEILAQTVRQASIHLLTPQSLTYPGRLERYDDAPPPILYALGNLSLLTSGTVTDLSNSVDPDSTDYAQNPHFSEPILDTQTYDYRGRRIATFSVALSNGAPPALLTEQDHIAAERVERGEVPVTGHDRPAYKRLALVAQRRNRPTVYVLDRGLREALGTAFDRPLFAAARIRDVVFDRERDLVISPFRLDDHAIGENNRRRDRMILALADQIVALDVRAGGNMMAGCLRAHEQSRTVLVAPGGRDGNEALRRAGCKPLI